MANFCLVVGLDHRKKILLKSSVNIFKNMYLNSKVVLNAALSEEVTSLLFGDQKVNESLPGETEMHGRPLQLLERRL